MERTAQHLPSVAGSRDLRNGQDGGFRPTFNPGGRPPHPAYLAARDSLGRTGPIARAEPDTAGISPQACSDTDPGETMTLMAWRQRAPAPINKTSVSLMDATSARGGFPDFLTGC